MVQEDENRCDSRQSIILIWPSPSDTTKLFRWVGSTWSRKDGSDASLLDWIAFVSNTLNSRQDLRTIRISEDVIHWHVRMGSYEKNYNNILNEIL